MRKPVTDILLSLLLAITTICVGLYLGAVFIRNGWDLKLHRRYLCFMPIGSISTGYRKAWFFR